jgi:thioredoxin 1
LKQEYIVTNQEQFMTSSNPGGKGGHAALAFTSANFKQEVLSSTLPVLVDFTATWCGPCQRLAPIIESLAVKYAGKVKIGKVDADANQDLILEYGIESVPTLLFFKQGAIVERVSGYFPENVLGGKLDELVGG